MIDRLSLVQSACTTSGQETERVHSYNNGARTGLSPTKAWMYGTEIDLSGADRWLVRSRSANLRFMSHLPIFSLSFDAPSSPGLPCQCTGPAFKVHSHFSIKGAPDPDLAGYLVDFVDPVRIQPDTNYWIRLRCRSIRSLWIRSRSKILDPVHPYLEQAVRVVTH